MNDNTKDLEKFVQDKARALVEKCVFCGAETPYHMDTPINQREFYVEGAGQLCRNCYHEIYAKKCR